MLLVKRDKAWADALTVEIVPALRIVAALSPKLTEFLTELQWDLPAQERETGGGTDYRCCPCGEEIARNKCDGTGRYEMYEHECYLTVLSRALQEAGG